MSAPHRARLYAPLILQPRRSRCLLGLLVGVHLLAGAALALARLHPLWTVPLSAAVAVSLTRALGRHWRPSSGAALRSAVWQADDTWSLVDHDGRQWPSDRWDAPLVHPRLVMLRFRQGRTRCRCLLLCPDAIDPEQLRRLRVRLRRRVAEPLEADVRP